MGPHEALSTGSGVTPLKSGHSGGAVSPPYREKRGLPFSAGLEFCEESRRIATRMLVLALGSRQVKEEGAWTTIQKC